MSFDIYKCRLPSPVAGWILATLLLGGCLLRQAEIPIPPSDQQAAKDSSTASKGTAASVAAKGTVPFLPTHYAGAPQKSGQSPERLPKEAETLRTLAEHVDAADDRRFTEAAESSLAAVRIEALRAWAASKKGPVPQIIVDLHYDEDPRVRSAALEMLATRKHPDALDYLIAALHDVNLDVRLAAVRGLGELNDSKAQAELAELLKDRAELVRAEAVKAMAAHGPETNVLAAANDPSWRVRFQAAAALAGYADAKGAAAARRMLNDPSAEVERQVVRSLAAWPLETAAPVLLEALARDAVSVRKLAADQLAERWPAAGRFPYEAPPARRVDALAELRTRCRKELAEGTLQDVRSTGLSRSGAEFPAKAGTTNALGDEQVERLVASGDFAALANLGPEVVGVLERLAIDRKQTLPEPIYRDVLPRYSAVFAALDRISQSRSAPQGVRSPSFSRNGAEVSAKAGTTSAAEELAALARKQPIGPLAAARLCALMTGENDAVVWLNALDAVHDETSEAAVRMARLALSQESGEVRRRACEFLAAHADPTNEMFLLPLLSDSEQGVVLAAIRALGAAGQMTDIGALQRQLSSTDEELQLATAVALSRLRDSAGENAILRLSYSGNFKIRGQLAQALGELGDERFLAVLVRLLDDSKATVSHAALASLPRVVGRDVAQSADGTSVSISAQMARWKKWWGDGGR